MNRTGFFTICLSLLFATPSFAQAGIGKRTDTTTRPMNHKSGHLMSQLNLSATQKAELKRIRDVAKPKIAAIRNNAKLTPAQKKERLKPILKAVAVQVKAILTPEQQTRLKELRQSSKNHRTEKTGSIKGAAVSANF